MNDSWIVVVAIIPPVTAFAGWITNWCAVRMLYWPERFVGIGPVGWQGVTFRHAGKFADRMAELLGRNLLSARDIVDRLDPETLGELYERAFDSRARPILRACWNLVSPGLWETVPHVVRDVVVGQVRRDGLKALREVQARVAAQSDEFIDIPGVAREALLRDGGRTLARLSQEVCARELRFVVAYGAVFGLLIGGVEALAWLALPAVWLLPLVGGLVGAATNWLALQMIFRPLEPTRFLGMFTYQGLFPSRQAEIARDYAGIAAREVVDAHHLLGALANGEGGQRLADILVETIREHFDAAVDRVRGPLPLVLVTPMLEKMKHIIVEEVLVALPELEPEFEAYLDRRLDVESLIRERLATLPKPGFERLLRGLFEEDEWLLVAIGGALGAAVGLGQALLVVTLG